MLNDTFSEMLSFPAQFPTGRFGHTDLDRKQFITPKKYFNQRVLNTDPRFARNIVYLFYSQYFTEMKQLVDSVNIAMRKGTQGSGGKLKAGMMAEHKISVLLKQDDGYRFIQSIRGSNPFVRSECYGKTASNSNMVPYINCCKSEVAWDHTGNSSSVGTRIV